MIPTPPPRALLPLSTTTSIPSHRHSNPFETPEIQISRPASPILLPTELDFHKNHININNSSDIESGQNSRSNSFDRSRSRNTSTSRDPLNRNYNTNKNNSSYGIWSQFKSILPFSNSDRNEVEGEELDELPRGRTSYLGGIDLSLGTIRTLEGEVNSVEVGIGKNKKRRRIGGMKVMSKNKAELTISFALIALVG